MIPDVMRLSEAQIHTLAGDIARDLVAAELVRADEAALTKVVARAIRDDMAVEEALDAEVVEILKGYQSYMRANNVEYSEMHDRIKAKLARERKLIL
jgi:hypothetical protein